MYPAWMLQITLIYILVFANASQQMNNFYETMSILISSYVFHLFKK